MTPTSKKALLIIFSKQLPKGDILVPVFFSVQVPGLAPTSSGRTFVNKLVEWPSMEKLVPLWVGKQCHVLLLLFCLV